LTYALTSPISCESCAFTLDLRESRRRKPLSVPKLKGLVAIVNGASRGIGAAIAKGYALEGAKVVVAARTEEPHPRLPGTIHSVKAEINEAGGEATALKCDISVEEEVQRLVDQTLSEYGKIDVVVNNAAVMITGRPVVDTEARHFLLGLRVNLLGPFLLSKYALPGMMERRSGSIINIGSGAALSRNPGGSNYASTKAGLERFTIVLAEETREYNIAVNCLDPGPIKSEAAEMLQPADHNWASYSLPKAVAPSAIFLAVQDAKSFTGQIVHRVEFRRSWP